MKANSLVVSALLLTVPLMQTIGMVLQVLVVVVEVRIDLDEHGLGGLSSHLLRRQLSRHTR